jgi:hypothetical protein
VPTSSIIAAISTGGFPEGIPTLSAAAKQFGTNKVVMGCRSSSPVAFTDGRALRQYQELRAAIRNADCRPVGIVGDSAAQAGKLAGGRPDLVWGVHLARRADGILCYRDLRRLFLPATFSEAVPFANYSAEDFAKLREIVGDVPLALIVPPETTVKALHVRNTKRGMETARAEGRLPGRPRNKWDEKMMTDIVLAEHNGVSVREICRQFGLPRTSVQRFLRDVDEMYG